MEARELLPLGASIKALELTQFPPKWATVSRYPAWRNSPKRGAAASEGVIYMGCIGRDKAGALYGFGSSSTSGLLWAVFMPLR